MWDEDFLNLFECYKFPALSFYSLFHIWRKKSVYTILWNLFYLRFGIDFGIFFLNIFYKKLFMNGMVILLFVSCTIVNLIMIEQKLAWRALLLTTLDRFHYAKKVSMQILVYILRIVCEGIVPQFSSLFLRRSSLFP